MELTFRQVVEAYDDLVAKGYTLAKILKMPIAVNCELRETITFKEANEKYLALARLGMTHEEILLQQVV